MTIPKEIDWKKVDDLLLAGCHGTEIAAYIGIHPDTLYLRCKSEQGMVFSAYSQEKKAKGESILRAHQYAKAVGLTTKGDNTLLIWLGKNRLKQRENEENPIPNNADQIDKENENMILKAKLADALEKINSLEGSTLDNIAEAGQELPGVDAQV